MTNHNLAQHFTPPDVVDLMLSLRKNYGDFLEPSFGDGAILSRITPVPCSTRECSTYTIVGFEIDSSLRCCDGSLRSSDEHNRTSNIHPEAILFYKDFFELLSINADTIISNPPYLRFKDIPESTVKWLEMRGLFGTPTSVCNRHTNLCNKYTNLYGFFIAECFNLLKPNGEMIFIVPSDVFTATGNRKFLKVMHESGTFTDVIRFDKSPFLPKVSQEVLIFRYERDNMSHLTNTVRLVK